MSEGTPRPPLTAEERIVHPRPPTEETEAPPRRRVSNLALRLVTAGMLIPPLLWVIYEGGLYVLVTVIVIALIAIHEFYQMLEEKGAAPLRGFGMAATAALPVVMYYGDESLATVLMTAVLLSMMVLQLTKAKISEALASISGTFFGVFYVGWLLAHCVVLRNFTAQVDARWPLAAEGMHPDVGGFYLLFTIASVIGGDVGAYFAGRAYGRRKLAPQISPGKTVEGALGALVAGPLIGLAFKAGFDVWAPELSANLSYEAAAVFAVILPAVGIVGDLIESLLKRDAKVKDTGTLLPGTGGVLDRIDSNLIAIPVMYYLMLAYTFVTAA
jgi:phosphatidate cytidylyltransferase